MLHVEAVKLNSPCGVEKLTQLTGLVLLGFHAAKGHHEHRLAVQDLLYRGRLCALAIIPLQISSRLHLSELNVHQPMHFTGLPTLLINAQQGHKVSGGSCKGLIILSMLGASPEALKLLPALQHLEALSLAGCGSLKYSHVGDLADLPALR